MMPEISWTEHVSKDEVLKKMKTNMKVIVNIRKKQFMRVHNDERGVGKSDTRWTDITGGKHRITYLGILSKRLMKQGLGEIREIQSLLKPTRESEFWKDIITNVMRGTQCMKTIVSKNR